MTTATGANRPPIEHPTPEERAKRGKAARLTAPRASHGAWEADREQVDPVAILIEQAKTRVPELVPIRHARMTASPFAFYRGGAAIMAGDLASTGNSGLRVQACGDAHLANFGGFAAPDRSIVFDINDFDETLPGPWEWDIKRLAASFEIASRSREFDAKTIKRIVRTTVRAYRESMRNFASMNNLLVWYSRLDATTAFEAFRERASDEALARFQKNLAKAQGKDSVKAFSKLCGEVDGEPRIISQPPLIVRVEDLFPDIQADEIEQTLLGWFHAYRHTLEPGRRHLLENYRLVDFARKVVGVGSVGTRTWIALLLGRDQGDPLFLQIKEAEASVLEPYVGKSGYANHGQRVVEGQRFTQSASDIFLGWERAASPDGVGHDFYVRQMWDGKFSAEIDVMEPTTLEIYGEMCGSVLARAHARSGDAVAIASYLGTNDTFDKAIAKFAVHYADQNEKDFEAVVAAIAAGTLASDPSADQVR